MFTPSRLRISLEVVRVDDFVAVALLGQEALAVLGKVLIDGVASDKSVKTCAATVGLWPQKAP